MEQTVTTVPVDAAERPDGGGLRRAHTPDAGRNPSDVLLPTTTQEADHGDTPTCGVMRGSGDGDSDAGVGVDGASGGTCDGGRHADGIRMLPGATTSSEGLWGAPTRSGSPSVVDPEAMGMLHWDTFVGKCRMARGLPEQVAINARTCYKTGGDGEHLDPIYSLLVAALQQLYNGCCVVMSDAVIARVASMNISSQAATVKLLSGCRVICQKAFGRIAALEYDKETTAQLTAVAKAVRKTNPRYTRPVDLGTHPAEGLHHGVWMSIVKERKAVQHLPDTSTRKLKVMRDHAIFLDRHDAISRSDCETKYDTRMEAHFRVYCEDGHLQTDPLLSLNLDAALVGEGGCTKRNYINPKDPRRKGEWSDTVTTQPLRTHLLVDTKVPWLETEQVVGFLCSVRVKRDLYRYMEALERMTKIPKGKTWVSEQLRLDGKQLDVQADTIGGLVKERAKRGGLRVAKSDHESGNDTADVIAGHFLRGHAGSVAYELAVSEGAAWDALLGVNRARHTLQSFMRNYSRGVAPRLAAAFRNHRNRGRLRFEEAARL